ncbi:titin-like [Lingula anatina]|uniref:Titin-like n=1 Tax=Lingula anatina TaxID=7574 RepID=A0A1S3JEK0_LINAN|nr:titin-like [Lingula anatina]|eukprot:XP_013408319.1 titin-like [Lingula anatina]
MASVKTTTTTVRESSTTTRRYVTENRTQRHFLRRYSLPSSEIQRFHTEHLADGNSHPVEETQTCSIEYNPDTGTQTKRTKTTTRRVRRTVTQGTSPPQVQNLGRSFYVLPIGQSTSPGVFKTGLTSNLQTSLSENVQERYYTLPLQRDSTTAAPYSQGQDIFDVNIPVRLVERRMSLPSSQIIQKITETRKTYTTNISDSLSSFPKRPPETLKFQIVPIDFEDGPGLYPTPPGKPDQPNLIPVFSKSPGPTPAGTEVPPKTDTKGVDGVKVQEPLLINMKPIAEDEIFPSPQKAQWVPAEPGKKKPDASKSGQQPPDKQQETKQPPNVIEKDLKGKPEMLKESEPMRFCVEPFVHEESLPVPQKIQLGSDKPGFESDFPEPQQASLTRHCDIPKKAQQPLKKPKSGLESPASRKPDTKSPSTVSPGSGAPDYDWIPYSGHPDVPISTKSMEIPAQSFKSEVKPPQPEKGRQKPDQRAGQPVPPFDDEFPTPQRLIASFEPDEPVKGTGRPKEDHDYQRPSPKLEGQVPQVISLATFPGEPISSEEAPQSVPQEIRIIHQDGRPGHPTPRDRSHPGEQVVGVPDITERNRPQGITQKSRKRDIPSASPYDRKIEPQVVNIIHQDMSPDRYPHFGPTDKRPGPQAVNIVYQDMSPAGHPYSGPTDRKPESQPVHIIHQEDYPDGHPYSGPVDRKPGPQPGNISGPDMKAKPRGPEKAVPKLVRQPRVYEGIGQVPGQKGKGMPTPRDRKEQSYIPPGGEVLEPQQVIVVASALPLKPQDTPRKPQGDRPRPGTDGDDESPAPQKANVKNEVVTPESGIPRDRKYIPGDREPGYQKKPELNEYVESPVPQKHMVSYIDMVPEPRTLDKEKGTPQGPQSDIPVVDRRVKDDDEFPMPQRANVMYQDITPERKRLGDRQYKPQDKRPGDGENEFPTPQRANIIYQVVTPEPQNTRVKQRIPVDKGVGSDDDRFPTPQKATIAYRDFTPESGKPMGKESRPQGRKPDAGNEEYPTSQKPFVTYQYTTPNVDEQGRHQVKRPHKYTPGSEEDDEFPIPREAAVLYQDITPESSTQRDRRDVGQVRPQDDRAYGKGKPEKDDDFSTPQVATVTNQIFISEPPGRGPERFPADRLGPGEEYLPQHRQDGKRSRPQGRPSKGKRSPENDDEFPMPQKAAIFYQDVTPELPKKKARKSLHRQPRLWG